jgi:large subunit ribosomal protein L32
MHPIIVLINIIMLILKQNNKLNINTIMAVPKQKTSKSKKGMRRSHRSAVFKNIVEDKKSGEYRLSHHVDAKTGMYNGKQIFKPKI